MRIPLPYWLDPSSPRRGGAISRLPLTFLMREAGEAPKYVWRWYLGIALFVVPVYFLTWGVSIVATWVGAVLLWTSLLWSLAAKIASAIVFPGGLSLTSRKFETNIAINVKDRVDELAKEVQFRCRTAGTDFSSVLPKTLTQAIEGFVSSIASSLAEHAKKNPLMGRTSKYDSLVQSLQQFVSTVEQWKQDPKNSESRSIVLTAAESLLMESGTLLDMADDNLGKSTDKTKGKRKGKGTGRVEPSSDTSETATVFEDDEEHGDAHRRDKGIADDDDDEDDDEALGEDLGLEDILKESDEDDLSGDNGSTRQNLLKRNKWKLVWDIVAGQVEVFREARRPFKGALSFDWARTHLELFHDGQSTMLDSHTYRIDVCFFKAKRPITTSSSIAAAEGTSEDYVSDQCVVMCNPNAGRYEQSALHPFWLDYYRSRQMNVVLWNYRGYGRSEGSPSPKALRQDIETLLRFVQVEKRCTKLLFHGESIGGIAACHAASVLHSNASSASQVSALLIADRTFSSLDAVARALAGNVLATILYYATGWKADNVQGFLSGRSGNRKNRLVLQDPSDDIVRHRASLKIGVARKVLDEAEFPASIRPPVVGAAVGAGEDDDVEGGVLKKEGIREGKTMTQVEEQEEAKFEKMQVKRLVESMEMLALAVTRLSFDSRIEHTETSTGSRVSFEAFSSEGAFRSICDFVKVLLNLDGGHGQLLGKALLEQLDAQRAQTEYEKSRLGKLIRKVTSPCSKIIATTKQNQRDMDVNYVWDWFCCALVFADDGDNDVLKANNQGGGRRFAAHGGFPLAQGLQLLKQVVEMNGQFKNEPADIVVHVRTVIASLEAVISAHRPIGPDLRGSLIALRCGHNGIPGQSDLDRIEKFLIDAGWNSQHYRVGSE